MRNASHHACLRASPRPLLPAVKTLQTFGRGILSSGASRKHKQGPWPFTTPFRSPFCPESPSGWLRASGRAGRAHLGARASRGPLRVECNGTALFRQSPFGRDLRRSQHTSEPLGPSFVVLSVRAVALPVFVARTVIAVPAVDATPRDAPTAPRYAAGQNSAIRHLHNGMHSWRAGPRGDRAVRFACCTTPNRGSEALFTWRGRRGLPRLTECRRGRAPSRADAVCAAAART